MLSEEDASSTVEQWVKESKTLRIFIFGKLGAGKSTLINSLLNEPVAEVGSGLGAVTTKVADYSGKIQEVPYKQIKIYDIDVTLWDTPGLQDPMVDKESLLEDISSNVGDNVDLYVYCIQMTQVRAEQGDYDAIADLTRSLGTNFWNRSLFALTFANEVRVPLSSKGTDLDEYFQERLKGWTKILRSAVLNAGVAKPDVDRIPVIPTGFKKERIPALMSSAGTPWFTDFWKTCLERIRFFSIPAFLKVNQEEWATKDGSVITARIIGERLQRLGDELTLQVQKDLEQPLLAIPPEELWGYLKPAILNQNIHPPGHTEPDSPSGQQQDNSGHIKLYLCAAAAAVAIVAVFTYWRIK